MEPMKLQKSLPVVGKKVRGRKAEVGVSVLKMEDSMSWEIQPLQGGDNMEMNYSLESPERNNH